MDISIMSESEIEVYSAPDKRIKQRVITYHAEGFAPRTVWVDASTLPDVAWVAKNPGKTAPADIVAQGDKARRAAIEADIARIKTAAQPRKI